MNINPDKVKQLVLIFSRLNEEYQNKLLSEAYKLDLMQSQLVHIKAENKIFKTDKELEDEVIKRFNRTAHDAIKLVEVLEKADETTLASFVMMVNQLAGKANSVEESDISITINKKEISMREYLEKYLVNADYNKARELANQFLGGKDDGSWSDKTVRLFV